MALGESVRCGFSSFERLNLDFILKMKGSGVAKSLTILDFEIADIQFQEFAQELFAGTDEKKKLQVLEGMKNIQTC